MSAFLKSALAHASSPLVTNGERILVAEFSAELNARRVLEAVGIGERTYTSIGNASGVGGPTLPRALERLAEKQLLEQRRPLAIPASTKDTRYQITDAGLRFWLRFIGPYVAELDRGRGDLVVDRILHGWNDFRGRSIEPLVREALTRLLPDDRFGAAAQVGSFWTRTNHPEVDLVGVDRMPKPRQVVFTGSIKWRDTAPFSDTDAMALARDSALVPGAGTDTLLVGVSRTGFDTDRLHVQIGPEMLINAFRPRP